MKNEGRQMMRWLGALAVLVGAQAMAATPQEAKSYIADLDAAIKAADAALKDGSLQAASNHSKRMNELKDSGNRFGETVLDKPFGYCFASGGQAQSWWQTKLSAARSGDERIPGSIDSAWKQYQSYRKACLEAVAEGGKVAETVQVKSTSDKPPYPGCLAVIGVRDDGKVGTVAYTCPKKK